METQMHAGNILQAWKSQDWPAFRSAMSGARAACCSAPPGSLLESERREVLASVVDGWQVVEPNETGEAKPMLGAALFLLRHLSASRTGHRLSLVNKNAS